VIQETTLTPELAARLLANPHPKQRRVSAKIKSSDIYIAIRDDTYRLIPDPILVDRETGQTFNGQTRCHCVILLKKSIQIYIDWESDATLFDLIDRPRGRTADQFIDRGNANARAAASRILLWYERHFDAVPNMGILRGVSLHEVLAAEERHAEAFDAVMPLARKTYEFTTLAKSLCLAVYALAYEMGRVDDVESFVAGIANPGLLAATAPARLLADRFARQSNRGAKRSFAQDWTVLVRAFNLHLTGERITKLQLGDVWPRVAAW
jgi:hypothetical protein